MDKQYIKNLVNWAKSRDIPVCFDEIQGGFWRTGKLFAYEQYEVEPDLVCMGKALGNGLPISALSGREKYFHVDGMSSTHSANPLCCAGALASIEALSRLDKHRMNQTSNLLSHWLRAVRAEYTCVESVNCVSLLAAIIFTKTSVADRVCELAMREGVLVVKTGRNSIKIAPPLTITKEALEEAIQVLTKCITQVNEEEKYVNRNAS